MVAFWLLAADVCILRSFDGPFCSNEMLYGWVKGRLQLAHSRLFIGPLKEFIWIMRVESEQTL